MNGATFSPVSMDALSEIEVSYEVSPHEKYPHAHGILLVRFEGAYRDGSMGRPDATYIIAMIDAGRRAWHTDALIVDFSMLDYRWGDEMGWIANAGHLHWAPVHMPLAVVVGDGCRGALESLMSEWYSEHCVETREEAVALTRRLRPEYEAALKRWRDRT